MNSTQKFSIQLTERCCENWFLPPEDTLGELSHLEMGLRRFCFEHNQKVLLEMGDTKQELFLDPDIILILDELPEKISQLLRNQKIELSFPESSIVIYLEPIDSLNMNFTWKNYGYSVSEQKFLVERYDLITMLKNLLWKIINQAVLTGYITDSEKEEFYNRIASDTRQVLKS
ncbi:hypothetical protein [Anabaena catenula]|uniref:Uncharacterized protein n=1 Tax=Anabaena catenula FACHB-362 TaxID=2692877 RepID=A0ABR8J5W9_9NOST|nr:hypothetical protein [Anabaena catenula]MBD2693759.1 hypothetical protein [Anabaena catenula FACHB-362]